MLSFITFLALAATASAGLVLDGPCPDLKPVENFNVSAYQGVWYEISKLKNVEEKDGKCSAAEYKLDGDVVKVHNSHISNGVQYFVDGTAKFAADANNAAKLLVTFKFGDKASEAPLSILTTDYNNYAIAYTCKYDDKKKTHDNTAWILSRTKKLEGDAKTAIDNYLKANAKELDATKFIQTDFSEEACKYGASSPIIAKPKEP